MLSFNAFENFNWVTLDSYGSKLIIKQKTRMSSDIVTCLQLDKNLSNRVIVVKEINQCDSSFIVSCLLNHCIKNKHAVYIISMHNSSQHYQNVGLRMNYNLQKHVQSGMVEFYNLGQEVVNNTLISNNIKLEDLQSKIIENILAMQQKHQVVNIICDGISHLFDLQYTLRDVNTFCKNIIELNNGKKDSFVLLHCNEAIDDDVTHIMANLLCHKAHTVLEVENLQSGLSADVSGHLTIKYPGLKYSNEHMFTMEAKPARYLFKLFDRGVKLFAPGTV